MMALMLSTMLSAKATSYYISPKGNNSNSGLTAKKAFATLSVAQTLVVPGDTVFILPGTYKLTNDDVMGEEVASSTVTYKVVFDLNKSGDLETPIYYIGVIDKETGKRPVFDLTQVSMEGFRITGFLVRGDFLILKNFEVVGIQVDASLHGSTRKTQSENIRVTNGSFNTFENIACHDGMGIGFYLTKKSACNLFVNCDGYNNYDPLTDLTPKDGDIPREGAMGTGGNNDGFGCHVNNDSPGNVFIGCRAWNNADDGYDLINCFSKTTFCYSIAYKNGYDADNKGRGDGNGFKAGGYGMDTVNVKIDSKSVPMHEVYHCIAASNKTNGIYSNHHLGGVWFHENTSYRNGSFNYSLVNRMGPGKDEAVDVNGYNHRLEYNLSMVSDGKDNHVTSLRGDHSYNILTGNTFYWVDKNSGGWAYTAYGNSIFESTKVADFIAPRDDDGMLSETTLAVMRQKNYLGLGCSFEAYQATITRLRELAGAEIYIRATGIIPPVNTCEDYSGTQNVWYDLQGRKIHQKPTQKGLYIHNGKKIIIK